MPGSEGDGTGPGPDVVDLVESPRPAKRLKADRGPRLAVLNLVDDSSEDEGVEFTRSRFGAPGAATARDRRLHAANIPANENETPAPVPLAARLPPQYQELAHALGSGPVNAPEEDAKPARPYADGEEAFEQRFGRWAELGRRPRGALGSPRRGPAAAHQERGGLSHHQEAGQSNAPAGLPETGPQGPGEPAAPLAMDSASPRPALLLPARRAARTLSNLLGRSLGPDSPPGGPGAGGAGPGPGRYGPVAAAGAAGAGHIPGVERRRLRDLLAAPPDRRAALRAGALRRQLQPAAEGTGTSGESPLRGLRAGPGPGAGAMGAEGVDESDAAVALAAAEAEDDERLAARLQAEEDAALARRLAARLEEEEHSRVMGRLEALEALEEHASSLVGRRRNLADAAAAAAAEARAREGVGLALAAEREGARGRAGSAGRRAGRYLGPPLVPYQPDSSDEEEDIPFRGLVPGGRRQPRGAAAAAGPGERARQEEEDEEAEMAASMHMPARIMRGGPFAGMARVGGGAAAPQGVMAAAAAAAAEERAGAAERARWSARSLNDMLPMALGMPFGGMAFGRGPYGPGRGEEGPGGRSGYRGGGGGGGGDMGMPFGLHFPFAMAHPGMFRSARHAEHAREVQEMMAAAQRAGIPARLVLSDRDFTPEDYEALCKLDEKVENRRGAHDDQLALLPTEVVPPSGRRLSDGSPAACAICLEETAPGEVLKRLPCGHCFHGGCLDTWLKTKAVCPVCQRGLD